MCPDKCWQTKTLLLEGPSFILLFAFEYLILTCTVASTFLKYLIYVIDMRRHGRWPSKPVFSFYLNLITDLTQACHAFALSAFCSRRFPCLLATIKQDTPTQARPPPRQLFLYLVFFAIVLSYYGMPLHIVRELYTTFASFQKRISDFVRYRLGRRTPSSLSFS